MTVVLDVSAAIEILLKKEKKDLFDAEYRAASWVIAPDLYDPYCQWWTVSTYADFLVA